MSNISEEDLILFYYKELPSEQLVEIEAKLQSDHQLIGQYNELQKLFNTTEQFEPEAVAKNFEQQIWAKVSLELDSVDKVNKTDEKILLESSQSTFQYIKSATAKWLLTTAQHPLSALALVVVLASVAYFVGRHDEQQDFISNPAEHFAGLSENARTDILFKSVSNHLERSSRLLTTVSMTSTDGVTQNKITKTEQQWAQQLLSSNRLYAKAAGQSGQWRIVAILEEMEPLLIEMAADPEQALSTRTQLQKRIKTKGLVFKTKAFRVDLNQEI